MIAYYYYLLLKAIHSRGGRYLEAMIQETVDGNAIEKSLILVAAGNKTLYEDCRPIFDAIANKSFYLGTYFICELFFSQMKQI